MKKKKFVRPRRGLRFSNGRRGTSPPVGFIGAEPLARSRPAVSSPEDEFSAKISGDVMRSTEGTPRPYDPFSPVISSSSLYIQGSVSMGRLYERKKLDALLLSAPTNSSGGLIPGVPAWPSPTTMEVHDGIIGVPTGVIIGGGPYRPDPPSWTHSYLGKNQSFVIGIMSSSNHEDVIFNTVSSGSESIESSAVPVSRVGHYSKEQRFQTITVKKTASFFDTVLTAFNSSSNGGRFSRPKTFVSGRGTRVSEITDTVSLNTDFTGSTSFQPCAINISVPVKGKLVDIKVWIELEHLSSSVASKYTALGNMGIALRSPNVSWNGWGNPIDNDPVINGIRFGGFKTTAAQHEMRSNSFILWDGASQLSNQGAIDLDLVATASPQVFDNFGTVGASNGNPRWFAKFASWDRDLSIRTVFSDGASCPNPRMNYSSTISGNFVGSPNSKLGINSAWGLGTSWTGSSGSPPRGWLTGPGGTADVNEWPTTGVNNGTDTIRPIYPLLDPIFQSIPFIPGVSFPEFMENGVGGSSFKEIQYQKLVGFRPGLRGTEISGTWTILISAGSESTAEIFELWFKQARLEITYESGEQGQRFSRQLPAAKNGPVLLYSVSGIAGSPIPLGFSTSSINTFLDVPVQNSISRTFGIQANSGALDSNRAVFYRLSGSLAQIVGPTPHWLFTGQGGMPIIPESSASLVPVVAQSISSVPFSSFLQPRRDLDLPQRLADVSSDQNPQVRLRDLATAFVSSSTT